MAMSPQSADHLVSQLQQAHRISVAFYRRILPTLDFIASELDCEFALWEPLWTSPVRGKVKPSTTWAWDYIPLFASNHIYRRVHGEYAQPNDLQLYLCLYVDDGFTPEARKRHGISGQPDAITLPVGKAVLQAWIYRPIAPSESALSELIANAADPEIGLGRMQEVGENVQAIAFEWSLAEVMQDVAPMLSILKQYAV
jgi:hypothetical protein